MLLKEARMIWRTNLTFEVELTVKTCQDLDQLFWFEGFPETDSSHLGFQISIVFII